MLSAFAGGRLFGERYGSGTPRVLALHGWGRSHGDWSQVLEGFDAIALDLPGFGATPPPEAAWGLGEYADAVRPVLNEMGQPIVLLGHSFGGSVAVRLASAVGPEAVRALVVTGSPLVRTRGGAKPPLAFRVARWLNARGLLRDSKMEELRNARGSADYRAASGVMRDTLVRVVNEDVADLLPSLSVPIELVWGENDHDVPVSVALTVCDLAPAANLTRLEGVGHDTPAEAPERLRRVLVGLNEPA
ncbi:MAG TPA: alpha/beta hydrolase [Acidimicrobiales bacterium]|nr:alpha/beta hydrolase [Acidimicrobiales bacterium]